MLLVVSHLKLTAHRRRFSPHPSSDDFLKYKKGRVRKGVKFPSFIDQRQMS